MENYNDNINKEGYWDPTPKQAMDNIQKHTGFRERIFRPVVYVCSPFTGNEEQNIQKVQKYCRFIAESRCIPVAPHLMYPQFLDNSIRKEREIAHFMGQVLLTKCAEVWVFGETISKGMKKELKRAEIGNKKVRYFDENMQEVDKWN